MLHCSGDMARVGCNCYFSFWAIFSAFTALHPSPRNSSRNENFTKMKKKKTSGGIIIYHKCTKNHDHMLYCSWDVVCDRCNCYFSFGAIFCPFNPLIAQKMNISNNEKNTWRYHHFTKMYQRWCEGCNCYFSLRAIIYLFTLEGSGVLDCSNPPQPPCLFGVFFFFFSE